MAPDINSLLPSVPPTTPGSQQRTRISRPMAPINIETPRSAQNGERIPSPPSPSPRSTSISLQAAATLNAGLQRDDPPTTRTGSSSSSQSRRIPSPSAGRRRSQVLTNLQIADPSVPAPGEMVAPDSHQAPAVLRPASPRALPGSPRIPSTGPLRHDRTPSLGELHQELENEQEFQVNRLLQEIRRLQTQVQRQQQGQSAIVDEPVEVPGGLRITGNSAPQSANPAGASNSGSLPRSPSFPHHHPRSSFDMARADIQRRSRTPSRTASPRMRSTSISGDSGEQWVLGGRDENAFYQAETHMLIRENQMLRHRIRDLERQLSEVTGGIGGAAITHEPSHTSNLARSTSASEDDSSRQAGTSTSTPLPTVADAPKEE